MSRDGTTNADDAGLVARLQARLRELELEATKAREEAARARTLLRGSLDAAPLPTVVLDPDGRLLDLNFVACEQYGDRQGLLGAEATELLAEESRPAFRQALRQVIESGRLVEVEVAAHAVHAGEPRALRTAIAPLRDEQGHVFGAVASALNPEFCRMVAAAEQQRAESLEALNRLALELAAAPADARFGELMASRLLAATGAQAVTVSRYDPLAGELEMQGICTRDGLGTANDALVRETFGGRRVPVDGHSRERMLSMEINAPPSLSEATRGFLPQALCLQLAERLGLGELRGLALQRGGELLGTALLMMPRGRPAPSHEMLQVLANLVAVTMQRAAAEEALRESNERFESFMEHFPSDAVIKDSQGRIVFANRRFVEHVGKPLAEILGRTSAEVWGSEDAPQIDRQDLDVLSGREVLGAERPLKGHTLSVYKFLLKSEGKPPLIGGFCIDVTARVRAEQERARLEERMRLVQRLEGLGQLAGGIGHEFNNLLTGILGHASLALSDAEEGSPARESLQMVISAARSAADLTRQLVAFAGHGAVEIRPLDLSAFVTEIAPLLELTVSKKTVIKYGLERGLPAVEADSAQLRQVLVNLLANAHEAIGKSGGLITISTARMHCGRAFLDRLPNGEELAEGDYVCLAVSDNGCGMPSELLSRAFEPFFTTKRGGTGLGLPEVVGIVRARRGAIHVESTPGAGTTVQVLLPACGALVEQAASPARRAESLQQWRSTGTVLVADDEDFVRLSAVRILGRVGFQVITACDGQEVVDWVRNAGAVLRLVLLDVSMPKLSGAEALREIRKLQPNLRVLLSSGYTEAEATASIPADQHSGFAQKPYDVGDLLSVVRNALGE